MLSQDFRHNTQPDMTRHRQSKREAGAGECVPKPFGSGKWLLIAGIEMTRFIEKTGREG